MINMIYWVLALLAVQGTLGDYVIDIPGGSTVNEGDEVKITCSIIGEVPGYSAIHWYRWNDDGSHSAIAVIEMMSDKYLMKRPDSAFYIEKEFEKLESGENDRTYTMVITAARVEDNAGYGCGTQEKKNSTMRLNVRSAPETILMYGSSNQSLTLEDIVDIEPYEENTILRIEMGAEGHFLCVADGFYPAPELVMTFNGKTLENTVVNSSLVTKKSVGNEDLHYSVYNSYIRTDTQLEMVEDANRLVLACKATLPGSDIVRQASVRPILNLSPRIDCKDEHVPSQMRMFKLSCMIEADPKPSQMYWQWLDHKNETTNLTAGARLDQKYSSTEEHLSNGQIKVSMQFDRVTADVYRTYNLYAENTIGSDWGNVTITRDYDAEKGSASSVFYSVGCLLMSAFLAVRQL